MTKPARRTPLQVLHRTQDLGIAFPDLSSFLQRPELTSGKCRELLDEIAPVAGVDDAGQFDACI